MQDGGRAFRNLRHAPGDIGDVVLVARCRGFGDQFGEEIGSGQRSHAAEDAEQRECGDFVNGWE